MTDAPLPITSRNDSRWSHDPPAGALPPRRCRVLFWIGSMAPGGAERQILEALKHLDRQRFEPYLCLAHRSGTLLPDVPQDVPIAAFWESFQGTWRSKLAWLTGTTRVVRQRWLAQRLADWQIDVICDRTYLATLDAAAAVWWHRTARVSMAVGDPEREFERYARGLRRLRWMESQRAYRTADVVLANSEGLRQQLIAYWQLNPELVRVQPNGMDLERIDRQSRLPIEAETAMETAAASLVVSPFRILTVGRIDADKAHGDLLAAVKHLVQCDGWTDLVWQIIGTGPLAEPLRRQVTDCGLTRQVEFLGVKANPFPFYRQADLFCFPSHSEGLPNVLLEAMACRLPVISTDCPSGPREILDGGRWGQLVPVGDIAAMVAAIRDCRANPITWKQRAEQAAQSIADRFDVRQTTRQLETVLSSAVERFSSRQRPKRPENR
jgi:glycosyltransferase involved in cell wall biosynthesis